jgi:hypothetical protein
LIRRPGFKDSIAVGPVESAEDHHDIGLIADALFSSAAVSILIPPTSR